MKQFSLSLSLLLSYGVVQCADQGFVQLLEKQCFDDHQSVLHHSVKKYKKLESIQGTLNSPEISTDNKKKISEKFKRAEVSTFEEYTHFVESNIVATILNLRATGFNLNLQNKKGETALFLAVKYNALKIASELLTAGANPNVGTLKHETPLTIACKKKHNGAMIKCLLDNGANIDVFFVPFENSSALLIHGILADSIQNTAVITRYLSTISSDHKKALTESTLQKIQALEERKQAEEIEKHPKNLPITIVKVTYKDNKDS